MPRRLRARVDGRARNIYGEELAAFDWAPASSRADCVAGFSDSYDTRRKLCPTSFSNVRARHLHLSAMNRP